MLGVCNLYNDSMRLFPSLLLVAAFFNALSWIILIPIWQYPDEQAHFAQVQDAAEFGNRPIGDFDTSLEIDLSEKILGTERNNLGNNKFTYHPQYSINYSQNLIGPGEQEINNLPKSSRKQMVKDEATGNPPLYYFLGSLVYKVFYNSGLFTRVISVRIMSSLIFLGTIFIAFKIGQEIFGENSLLSITLPSLIAFKPMMVFSSTGVLPDTLTNLLFTGILYISLQILLRGIRLINLLALLVILILGVFTRQQFLIVMPIVAFPLLLQLAKTGKLKLIILPSLLIFIFLFFSNTFGTVLPFFWYFRIPESSIFFSTDPSLGTFFSFFKWTVHHSVSEVLPWYWGVYKWLSLTVPHINYQIINRLILIAFVGVIIKLFQIIKSRKIERWDLVLFFMIYAVVIYFLIFLLWDYYFYLKNGYSFGIQGRYFFAMIVPHFTILVIGLWQVFQSLFRKSAKYVLVLIILSMIVFNNVSLSYVSATYYEATNISTFVKQASQYKPQILKGYFILATLFTAMLFQAIFLFAFTKHIFARRARL